MSATPSSQKWGQETSHTLHTQTLTSPYSYAHLQLVTDSPQDISLDNLLVKSYCTAALKQFLGLTGQAIPIDILKAQNKACWVRLPREDVKNFSAAITAYRGSSDGDTRYILRLKRCSDWLGLLADDDGEEP